MAPYALDDCCTRHRFAAHYLQASLDADELRGTPLLPQVDAKECSDTGPDDVLDQLRASDTPLRYEAQVGIIRPNSTRHWITLRDYGEGIAILQVDERFIEGSYQVRWEREPPHKGKEREPIIPDNTVGGWSHERWV